MSNYALSQRAEEDIESILDYIAEDDPQAALSFYKDLERVFRRLARHPRIGRERNEITQGIRSIPIGRYLIFFELENPVQLIRVLHSAMDLDEAW
ncbi:MAG: type II toxin-antitoxin system RelE/ParE family toxin [Opitutales bacterium]|nr:type II toxin-antitoxin system RelE/ParE family toxin [Opitutales bacterium]